ncbi:pentapeptide repeat-containing protein [Streptomyces cellulosae]
MSTESPNWDHCGYGTTPDDPIGCPGIQAPPFTACLAHLTAPQQNQHLATLEPGSDCDYRGTSFTNDLLTQLKNCLAETGPSGVCRYRFGVANFSHTSFDEDADLSHSEFGAGSSFEGARFGRRTNFHETSFSGEAIFAKALFGPAISFEAAIFDGEAHFDEAEFDDAAQFHNASFSRGAVFRATKFGEAAWFEEATFRGRAWFTGATFENDATFARSTFGDKAFFFEAKFGDQCSFERATFGNEPTFSEVIFGKAATFEGATFGNKATFIQATFGDDTTFEGATFGNEANFGDAMFGASFYLDKAVFGDKASFHDATFEGALHLAGTVFLGDISFMAARMAGADFIGPILSKGAIDLGQAIFEVPVTIYAAARRVDCWRTRWRQTASLGLRYAEIDLTESVCEFPLTVAASPTQFLVDLSTPFDETPLLSGLAPGAPEREPTVYVDSISGIDATYLVLNGVDMSECLINGAIHLDQMRLTGDYRLATSPNGLRYTKRDVLAEEQHWRARNGYHGWTSPAGWDGDPLTPATIAPLYRQLRKGMEDSKDEPGAADFYYGEMEMRRKDRTRPLGERTLLNLYWALSGHGLRATRALAWFALTVAATLFIMTGWGIAKTDPKPETTRQVVNGKVVYVTDNPDPVNPTDGQRFTSKRFEKSLRVVINSVVFRSSGQNLTTTGTYVEMVSRLTEPILLGFAALAIRGRVKR